MFTDISAALALLVERLEAFHRVWPRLVVSGKVWQLPVLAEQKAPDLIEVHTLEGEAAIATTRLAMSTFERVQGQAPGTVMRLPGYFVMRESVLEPIREINLLKDQLLMAIEQTRIELNLAATARSKILRQALGHEFSMKQLARHSQAFDVCPRLLVFTWAGHTTGGERITVGKIREYLDKTAKQQATKNGVALEQTQAGAELRRIVNLSDQATLIKYKKVAPHPRAMVYFSGSSRYDAMIHSNLPMFVLAGNEPTIVHDLRDFDRHARQAERPDKKLRIEVIPRMNLCLNPDDLVGQQPLIEPVSRPCNVESTYSQSRPRIPVIKKKANSAQLRLNLPGPED